MRGCARKSPDSRLKVNFREFYDDYLKVGLAPEERPYLLPFVMGRGEAQLFNKNVAGSYAPSSVREVAPIRDVLEFEGSGSNVVHRLKGNHERLALAALVSGQRIPLDSLAVFLFRDHKIQRSHDSVLESVAAKFCRTFGYDLAEEQSRERFEILYERDPQTFNGIPYAAS